jgi:hypothetical protein
VVVGGGGFESDSISVKTVQYYCYNELHSMHSRLVCCGQPKASGLFGKDMYITEHSSGLFVLELVKSDDVI